MKKRLSLAVPATLVCAVASAMLSGCRSTVNRDCVDSKGNLLPESACNNTTYHSTYYPYPHWIYGGTRSGGNLIGGTMQAPNSAKIVSGSTGEVVRGGFGSTGASHGFFSGFHGFSGFGG